MLLVLVANVTLEEARRILGIDADAAADVRRSYLKLVKVHSPERDPDGFQRLRQAYELLSTRNAILVDKGSTEVDSSVPGAALREVGQTSGEAEAPPSGDAQASSSVVLPDAVLAPFRERVAALAANDGRGAVSIWSEAVAAHPDCAAAWWALYNTQQRLGWRSDAGVTARDACAQGILAFAAPLLAHHPRAAPPELIEQAYRDVALRGLLPSALVERHELGRAVEVMRSLLTDATEGREVSFYPEATLHLIARAVMGGEKQAAHELLGTFARFLNQTGAEMRVLKGAAAAQWALLREADRLSAKLPAPVFESFVSATVPDYSQQAFKDLLIWSSNHGFRAKRVLKLLSSESPELHGTFAGCLSPVWKSAPGRWRKRGLVFVVWLVATNAIRYCGEVLDAPHTTYRNNDSSQYGH